MTKDLRVVNVAQYSLEKELLQFKVENFSFVVLHYGDCDFDL